MDLRTPLGKIDSLRDISDKAQVDRTIPHLQYDSSHPEDVPWKQLYFSEGKLKDGIREFRESASSNENAADIDIDEVKSEMHDVKAPSIDPESLKQEIEQVSAAMLDKNLNRSAGAFDSLYQLRSRLEAFNLQQELLQARRIYSDKFIQKLYDSLGLKKADSIFRVGEKYAKSEIPKEKLLNRLNAPINELSQNEGVSYNKESGALSSSDAEKLRSLPGEMNELRERGHGMLAEEDLADIRLPMEELGNLPPLPALQVDGEKLPVIDSLRDVAMQAKNVRLDEDELTDELKRATFKQNLSFFDKSYFEGILGVINDSAFTIVQISPSLGYHFTKEFSFGLGPVLSVDYEQRKINAVVGFRSFIKGEFWKQRGYLQFEDNARPVVSAIENVRTLQHTLLAGAGGLLPLSEKLAINVAIFHRVNQEPVRSGGSPWVFRVGLSTIKNIRH